jgi:transposase-like protein
MRRREKEEIWRRVVKDQEASGVSAARFCREHSIGPQNFYWWRKKIRRRAEASRHSKGAKHERAPALIPVRVSTATVPSGGMFEVVLANRRVVRVAPGFDVETLARLVVVLEAGTC